MELSAWRKCGAAALLLLLVAVLYGRVAGYGFVNYDDNLYFSENSHVLSGLSWEGVRWAFGIHGPSMWVPMTWLSHQAMVEAFGATAAPQHMANVVLHGANAVLLMVVLGRLTGSFWKSFFVALLFTVHPIHVESVAWVTERKDVLALFFCLLSLLAYERYARGGGWKWYAGVLALHTLAVMAKPLAVTLPCVMLLLDWWPLGRGRELRRVIAEKLPLLLVSGLASWLTILCQQAIGAIGSGDAFPLSMRIANAVIAYGAYLRRAVWPTDLAAFYPYPGAVDMVSFGVGGVVLLLLLVVAWRLRKRLPAVAVGLLWFLGVLVPMIGLVQAGSAQMADRYAYFSFPGLYLAVIWMGAELVKKGGAQRIILCMSGGLWFSGLLVVSVMQVGFWKDSEALFRRAIEVTDGNYLAHNNLGLALRDKNETELAREQFKTSLKIKPGYEEAMNNLGILEAGEGRFQTAGKWLQRVVELNPGNAIAWHNLGKVYAEPVGSELAEDCFREAIRLRPEFPEPRYDLGTMLIAMERWGDAIQVLEELVARHPEHADGWVNIGFAAGKAFDMEKQDAAYLKAVDLGSQRGKSNLATSWIGRGKLDDAAGLLANSRDADDFYRLGEGYRKSGRFDDAKEAFGKALGIHPGHAEAWNELGTILGSQGDHVEALRHFREALRIWPQHPSAALNISRAEAAIKSELGQ